MSAERPYAASAPDASAPGLSEPDPIDRLAAALRLRVEALRRTEEALAAFAFREEAPADAPSADAPVDWRYHAARALGAVAAPTTLSLVAALAGPGRTIDELSRVDGLASALGGDRLAIAEAVAALASAGLAVRQLETDRVQLTPLGEALLALVDDIARRAAEGEA